MYVTHFEEELAFLSSADRKLVMARDFEVPRLT